MSSETPADPPPEPEVKRRIAIGSQRSHAPAPTLRARQVLPPPTPAEAPAPTPLVDLAAEAVARHHAARQSASTPTDAASAPETTPPRERQPRKGNAPRGPRADLPPAPSARVALPNLRQPLEDDLAGEFEEALGGVAIDDLLEASVPVKAEAAIEPGSRLSGTVLHVGPDSAFVDLGARRQGVIKLVGLEPSEFPEVGQPIDVSVGGRNEDDGLYDLAFAGRAVSVEDYSQIEAGMVVEARVVAANKGGVEADVAGLRGFIPASLVSVWRVENLEELVGQSLECLVTEIVPAARRLVLSRRAVIERQAADAKAKLLETLEVGTMLDGVVRSVRDFGAFIDIGHGVEGLVHVSQLSWDRVANPADVLQPGQKVRVVVKKVDRETGKISLSARDLVESPWKRAAEKYHVGATVRGTVSRVAQFGAFVRLEPGIEGLVHVSELAHRHVRSVSDVAKEGEEVECRVLSIDPDEQRMSLSIKAAVAAPSQETASRTRDGGESVPAAADEAPPPAAPPKRRTTPLKGGTGGASTGERFGLRW